MTPAAGNSDQFDEITVITEPVRNQLTDRQLLDYRTEREDCLDWLLTFGKNPEKAEGYAVTTVSNRAYRMDQFYRWVWQETDGYTSTITIDHADTYLKHLARQDTTNEHKDTCRKALMMLYKWRHHERGGDPWEPSITFTRRNQTTTPRDYLMQAERRKVREAALEYGSIPSFDSVHGEKRERWKRYLAQRWEKPKSELSRDDWERANNWKIASLTWASLDAALRPIEVERAKTSWVDTENGVLRIPREDASKNSEPWVVGLKTQTSKMLDRWETQRDTIAQYDDTDSLWLTREGNPYGSAALRTVLHRLCDIAGIDIENRKMSWYSIRHSTGTYMAREEDLAAAQSQLRHLDPKSTMKYDQVPVENRKNALDRMG
ncbi:integrase/recombinase XerD [Halalkaliarchaeum desulfuricum]|uniref:Integrase/recombinase XerD n=1 Tax=Halalkaliarchaeum desulfuricum TaxID=2055893 RepID=A0A343TL58_9EURY|nr:site-specific integrase [Halalkaliarchaeum desulfuricum]AUX09830.1 integrase/recombinase XerD [Halalkaliarchaeum desulfuricum]